MEVASGNYGLVLMYHRIVSIDVDPWDLCVSPERFDEQLEYISRNMTPSTLSEVQQNLPCDRPRIAVTFDDGYADNLYNALPLLEQHQVPANIFIVSNAIESTAEFWWDELESIVLYPGELPANLELQSPEWEFSRKLTFGLWAGNPMNCLADS